MKCSCFYINSRSYAVAEVNPVPMVSGQFKAHIINTCVTQRTDIENRIKSVSQAAGCVMIATSKTWQSIRPKAWKRVRARQVQ